MTIDLVKGVKILDYGSDYLWQMNSLYLEHNSKGTLSNYTLRHVTYGLNVKENISKKVFNTKITISMYI